MLLGALEAGGTKMVCAVGDEDANIINIMSMPTKTPAITIPKVIEYFKQFEIEALGIGCFGPIDLNKGSNTYGYITSTPKLAWQNYNIVGAFKDALGVPVGFDTDVNASCLGEVRLGSSRGCQNLVYITIGTGVGMGIYSNGKLIHGMLHPEAGHMLLDRHSGDDFKGNCPFHSTCAEGFYAGPAIEKRTGKKAFELEKDDKIWDLIAHYIGQTCTNLILTVSPERIILGGGLMKQEHLFAMVRKEVVTLLNGYIKTKEIEEIDQYIVPASLMDNQGIKGALLLGMDALLYK